MIYFVKIFLIVAHTLIMCNLFVAFYLLESLLFKKIKHYYLITRLWARGILKISGIQLQIHTPSPFNLNQNYIFVSNHASFLDIPILIHAIPHPIKIIAKKGLAWIPFLGFVLQLSHILIHRQNDQKSTRSIKKLLSKLKQNPHSILIFPEGTRNSNHSIQPFKKGAFFIAFHSQLDILPIAIVNSHSAWKKNSLKISPAKVQVIFSKPVPTRQIHPKQKKNLIHSVQNSIQNQILHHSHLHHSHLHHSHPRS